MRSSPAHSPVPRRASRRRPVAGDVRAGRPRRARRHPAPVLQPGDPRRGGSGSARSAPPSLAFLWPSGGAGVRRQGRRRLRSPTSRRDRQQDAVLQRRAEGLHRRLPQGRPRQGEEGLRTRSILAGMEQGYVALYQKCVHLGCRVPWCRDSQWFECPCHGSKYNRVGEKRGGPGAAWPRPLPARRCRAATSSSTPATSSRPADRHQHHRTEPGGRALRLTSSRPRR